MHIQKINIQKINIQKINIQKIKIYINNKYGVTIK